MVIFEITRKFRNAWILPIIQSFADEVDAKEVSDSSFIVFNSILLVKLAHNTLDNKWNPIR